MWCIWVFIFFLHSKSQWLELIWSQLDKKSTSNDQEVKKMRKNNFWRIFKTKCLFLPAFFSVYYEIEIIGEIRAQHLLVFFLFSWMFFWEWFNYNQKHSHMHQQKWSFFSQHRSGLNWNINHLKILFWASSNFLIFFWNFICFSLMILKMKFFASFW